jgi:hypothetical protein
MAWIDVPHPHNPDRLLFRFDPERLLIQGQERGQKFTVDLQEVAVEKQGIDIRDKRLYDKGSSRCTR